MADHDRNSSMGSSASEDSSTESISSEGNLLEYNSGDNNSSDSNLSSEECDSDSSSSAESSIYSVSTVNSDSPLSEEISNRLSSLKAYIQETNVTSLNLESSGVTTKELKEILDILPNSEIADLNLKSNRLQYGMKQMAEVLPSTKIKKLNLSLCSLSKIDLVHLMGCLKNTQVTDIDVSNNSVHIGKDLGTRIIPYLCVSHLTNLSIGDNYIRKGAIMMAEAFPNTPITYLNLSGGTFYQAGLISLFSLLQHTSITHLILSEVDIDYDGIRLNSNGLNELVKNLRYSKLTQLDLSNNPVDDSIMNDLVTSLMDSNIIDLSLYNNRLSNLEHIFLLVGSKLTSLNIGRNSFNPWETFLFNDFFMGSSIHTLNVCFCKIDDKSGQKLMKSLRFSKIVKLDISGNELGLASMVGFAEVAKDTLIEDLNLSKNDIPCEALAIFGDSLPESKLRFINLNDTSKYSTRAAALAKFIERTKGSKIESLKIGVNQLGCCMDLIAPSLCGTKFTHFDVGSNEISDGIVALAAHLKFSAITHLDLSHNNISDASAEAFAAHLKDTRIIELNLTHNCIQRDGVTAIALNLKNSSLLSLTLNVDEDNGLRALTDAVENTFITAVNVVSLSSSWIDRHQRPVILDKVLWDNRLKGFKLVAFFKTEIMPYLNDNNFCFDRSVENLDADTFLEKWLTFYKTVTEQPSALSFLAQDESIPFSREQLASLFLEEFPQQITLFVCTRVEANVAQHITFLERVEGHGLTKIVELLLLNRPTYMIDENQEILHPFVYKLLLKYKQPVCNVDIEPQAKQRIIDYFTSNPDLEGASDVIRMLCDEESV